MHGMHGMDLPSFEATPATAFLLLYIDHLRLLLVVLHLVTMSVKSASGQSILEWFQGKYNEARHRARA